MRVYYRAQQLAGGVAVKDVIREGSLATKTKAFASLDSAKEPFTGGFAAETFPNVDEKPLRCSLRLRKQSGYGILKLLRAPPLPGPLPHR